MRYLLLLSTGVVVLGLALVACGSSGTTSAPHPVPGGAAARPADSAPGYCRSLTTSAALLGVGKAMDELAANPHDSSAKVTLRKAAAALREAARQAPRSGRPALVSASEAVRALADHGFGEARRTQRALVRVGHEMEHPCAFPVG